MSFHAVKVLLLVLGMGWGLFLGAQEGSSAEDTDPPGDKAASEAVQEIIIRPEGNMMKYAVTEFTVKAGQKVRLIMDNIATNAAMIHNVVILQIGADIHQVGLAAIKAGAERGYIPDMEEVLYHTPLAKPGEKTQVEFIAPPPGDYPYICSYPGHFTLMFGTMHSVE
ncbi:MAG: hypothetical protein D6681_13855 [Calditrichaeota bacterium]|nr:MAG: hypothetical protein D6681_13855 [Calditrichota bacterium]